MKKEYSVGELADLFGVNAQTLRYYEKIDLFKPETRNLGNDYRSYSVDQIYEFAAIRFYKNCGYTLKQIANNLKAREAQESVVFLRERHQIIEEKLASLHKMEEAIRYRLDFIETEKPNWSDLSIRRKTILNRGFNPIGAEANIYKSNTYYLYPTIVIYENEVREFGAQVNISEFPYSKVRELEGGEFLCCFHVGRYINIEATQGKLRKYAHNLGLKTVEYFISVNHIDPLLEKDRDKFITDVQLKIVK